MLSIVERKRNKEGRGQTDKERNKDIWAKQGLFIHTSLFSRDGDQYFIVCTCAVDPAVCE